MSALTVATAIFGDFSFTFPTSLLERSDST